MENDNKALQASLSCFSQNSSTYNFFSNENMTLKLHMMTHFYTFFRTWYSILSLVADILNFSNLQGGIYEYGVYIFIFTVSL